MRPRSILHKCTGSCPLSLHWTVACCVWWLLAPVESDMAAGAMGPPCRGAPCLWRHPFEASKCHETSPSGLTSLLETKVSCTLNPYSSPCFNCKYEHTDWHVQILWLDVGWVGFWASVELASVWLVDLCFGGWGHLMTVEGRMEAKSHGFPWLSQLPLAHFQIWSHFLRLACADICI